MSKRIVEILCRRDGISVEEAKALISRTKDRMAEADYAPCECEDIIAEELGLEMDYIFDLIF